MKETLNNNFWLRMLGEMCGAFLLIFIINSGQAIGESLYKLNGGSHEVYNLFYYIYNWNLITALWIGSWTFVAFILFRKTSIACNFFNLVISYKHNEITKDEFWHSLPFQLIGGLFAAYFVIIISLSINDVTGAMGGTITSMKSLMTNNDHIFDFNKGESIRYGYAAVQGLINAFAIIFLYTINVIIDRNNGKGKALTLRFLVLVPTIFITTIFYANTTNWIRLLSPAVMSAINNWETEFLTTTLVFISTQTIGLLVVYNLIKMKRS